MTLLHIRLSLTLANSSSRVYDDIAFVAIGNFDTTSSVSLIFKASWLGMALLSDSICIVSKYHLATKPGSIGVCVFFLLLWGRLWGTTSGVSFLRYNVPVC